MITLKAFASPFAKAAIGLAAASLFAGAASAEQTLIVSPNGQSQVTVQKQVRFGDLDLSTEQGRAKLDRRIKFAASDVCDGQNVSNTKTPFAFLDCYVTARNTARAEVTQRLASAQSSTVAAVR